MQPVNQQVTAGVPYETFVYQKTGSIHFDARVVPLDGEWTVQVVAVGAAG